MRPIVFVFLLLSTAANANEWRTQDTVREVVWQAINIVDMGTTLDLAKQNEQLGYQRYTEINPLIGHNPTPEQVTERMVIGAVAHAAISYALPHKWRDAWQYLSIGSSAAFATNNLEIGLKVNF